MYWNALFYFFYSGRVQRKQNKYPTLLLTNGEDQVKYVPYLDLRTRSIDMAIYFATFANLLVGTII